MTKTTLIIARHGNTFTSDQTPTRVGARTDLDLVPSGLEQGTKMGLYLSQENLVPDVVFASKLKRAYQTAEKAIESMSVEREILTEEIFNEIDYGPDENKTEDDVIARIGEEAIRLWNEETIVPDGWLVDPQAIIQNWIDFGKRCETEYQGKTILAVTSNGIARFSPHLTGDFETFKSEYDLKISTGAVCILEKNEKDTHWCVKSWNIKPKNFV